MVDVGVVVGQLLPNHVQLVRSKTKTQSCLTVGVTSGWVAVGSVGVGRVVGHRVDHPQRVGLVPVHQALGVTLGEAGGAVGVLVVVHQTEQVGIVVLIIQFLQCLSWH